MTQHPCSVRCIGLIALLVSGCPQPGNSTTTTGGGSSSGGASSGGGPSSGTSSSGTGNTSGRFFPDDAPWYQDVSNADVDPDSEAMIAALQQAGFGLGRFQMDFSIEVLDADANTPRQTFETTSDFYEPDCDHVPMPVPVGGNLEGEDAYECTTDGDCHLIVADWEEQKLYEMWRADMTDGTFRGGCLAVWDMTRTYPPEGRGEQCTSADAAGYPIAPLLFTADEVAAGEINHAIRFALPNDRIRDGEYYHPASHATNAGGGGATAIPYGARLRLRQDYPIDENIDVPGARVIARALQRYGMLLADGGNVTLMGRSDRRTTAKWTDLLGASFTRSLAMLQPQDFEVVRLQGPAIPLTFDCMRNGL